VENVESLGFKNRAFRASIVIPVYNRAELLYKCLCSLIAQDMISKDFEILVCDDGSAEDMESVIKKFQLGYPIVRLFRQPRRGPAAARNLGIRASTAPIIIFLDSDVVPDKALVYHLVTALERNQQWLGAEGRIEPFGNNRGPLWDAPTCNNGGRYQTAVIAYRRKALITAGGFDEAFRLPACEDVELAYRVLMKGLIGFVTEAIVYHPTRRITLNTYWNWRRFWKYVMILAKRYGFLAFPGRSAGRFPRLRVAFSAIVTLPGGRFINACKHIKCNLKEGLLAGFYALFDGLCGLCVLPDILFASVPPRRNYLEK
jgi:glycosyltransferase involved in cell wall biosynthesis